jgi:uncharacterized protein
LDADSDEDFNLPERTCIVTRVVMEPDQMIRFVAAPDGRVVPDIKGKLPGRGAWVSLERPKVEEAIRRKLFARALKSAVTVESGLAELVDQLLAADAIAALSFANKAGKVIAGFNKVESTLAGGGVAALLMASDGAEDGKRKMAQVLRRFADGTAAGPAIMLFSSAQLSLCLGRENVIHAALLAAPVSGSFVAKCLRLQTYRQNRNGETGHGSDGLSDTGPF